MKTVSSEPCKLATAAELNARAERREVAKFRTDREKHADALATLKAKTEDYAKHNVAFERSLREKGWWP